MDFFGTFFVTGDAGGEPVVHKAELEDDVQHFADYERKAVLTGLCVIA